MIIGQFLEIESFLTPKAHEIERLQVVSRQGWNAPWMELFEAHQQSLSVFRNRVVFSHIDLNQEDYGSTSLELCEDSIV